MAHSVAKRVFISYSHDTPFHKQKVLDLAQQLRSHGVDAQIDQFLLGSPKEGWPRWMERQMSEADFVLMVCTPAYKKQFDSAGFAGEGLGATWESIVARQDLYDAKGISQKYIPVAFQPADLDSVPKVLRQFNRYLLMQHYTELLRVLLDQPNIVPVQVESEFRIGDSSDAESLFRQVASLPLPLSQTLLRSLNAKTAADVYLSAQHFCETMLHLATASHLALYLHLEAGSEAIERELESLRWTSAGYSIELLADITTFFDRQPELGADSFFGPVYQRLMTPRAWTSGALIGIDETETNNQLKPLDVLRRIVRARESPVADISPEHAAGMRDLVCELYAQLRPFGSCRLARGSFGTGNTTDTSSYQYLSLHGDGLRLPLVPGIKATPAAGKRESGLWWIGSREPLSLFPFAVHDASILGLDRAGFLHLAAPKASAANSSRKIVYLDYHSGDYLDRFHAASEFVDLLSRLKGHSVSQAEVQSSSVLKNSGPSQIVTNENWIGDFQILGELGRGSMGIVYKARQASLGRIVALKILPPKMALEPSSIGRFELEIETLGRCDHPNIVKVLTAGREGDTRFYAMEFVDGSDLAHTYAVLSRWTQTSRGLLTEGHLLAALRGRSTSLSKQDVDAPTDVNVPVIEFDLDSIRELTKGKDYFIRLAELMADAARGLQHLHDHQTLHRDIKPGNLMLTADGKRIVLMDLGLAKVHGQESIAGSTQVKILGTLRYMAPEQLQRKLIQITPQADVYGLGATLYELVCLRAIFDGDTEERLSTQVLFEQPAKPRSLDPTIPRALELIIEKATAKVPQSRYATATQLAQDLDSFAKDGFTIHAKPPTHLQRLQTFVAQRKWQSTVAAALLAITVAGLWAWDYNRIKTIAYRHVIYRHQIPEGKDRLSSDEWRRIDGHNELVFRRRRVIGVRTVNSTGRFIDDDFTGASEERYSYNENGGFEVQFLNHNGVVKLVEHVISSDAEKVTLEGREGTSATLQLFDLKQTKSSRVARYEFDYDSAGRVVKQRFQDAEGQPISIDGEHYGRGYGYDPKDPSGLTNKLWELDERGNPKLSRNNVAEERFERDLQGLVVSDGLFDIDGNRATGEDHYSYVRVERDPVGNATLYSFFSADNKKVVSTSIGCASLRKIYTSEGFVREQDCLDIQNGASPSADGVAIKTFLYDEQGNAKEMHNLSAKREPVYSKEGISIVKSRFEEGNEVDKSYFADKDGRVLKVLNRDGVHRLGSKFRNGLLIKALQYDIEGNLTKGNNGIPVATFEYKDGRETKASYYEDEAEQRRAVDEHGIHEVQKTYNRGNETEEAYYDKNDHLIAAMLGGVALIKVEYDDGGDITKRSYWGRQREPILSMEGIHECASEFNAAGKEVRRSFFGVQHEPITNSDGYSFVTQEWNKLGQVFKIEYFGVGGIPVNYQGVHRFDTEYDERGNAIATSYFGKDGSPTNSNEGYHLKKDHYDRWGHVDEERYFGLNKEPIIGNKGYHRIIQTYDDRGEVKEIKYFGAQEQPILSTDGYHSLINTYDYRGFRTEYRVLGINGEPVRTKDGAYRVNVVYDDFGHDIEVRFFDDQNRLVLSDGTALTTVRYDVRGNVIEVAYHGPDEKPILRLVHRPIDNSLTAEKKRRYGTARANYIFDDANRKVTEQFFGTDNNPANDIYGVSRVEFLYNGSDKPVEKWFDSQGRYVAVRNLEPN